VLLNESNYIQLREAGVNQFSVSLDFLNEWHYEFRGRRVSMKVWSTLFPCWQSLDFGILSWTQL